MNKHHSKCLLLNADYTPLSIIDWKKAIVWHMRYESDSKYGIDIVDFYKNDYILGAHNKKYPIPCIAKTKKFFKIHKQVVTFSRRNIFIRDDYTCQYCHKKCEIGQLTYDHVIPKSKWRRFDQNSPTHWTNIVTACIDCNRKKGNRTPQQADMPLLNLPHVPNKNPKYLPVAHLLRKIEIEIPQEWKLYLPESYNA